MLENLVEIDLKCGFIETTQTIHPFTRKIISKVILKHHHIGALKTMLTWLKPFQTLSQNQFLCF